MTALPELDEDFLNGTGWTFSAVAVLHGGSNQHEIQIVIKDYELPPAYQPRKTDLLIRLPPNYPVAAPDMFWTTPWVTVAATGAKPQAAEVLETYSNVSWQRWSRHFDPARWRPMVDGVETYLRAVRTNLDKGV
jgi:hypothetical protein